MKLRFPQFATLCLLLYSVSATQAADWYVSGSGDDSKAGTTMETAFRTLQKAGDLVEPGDTVHIGDGIYRTPETNEDSAVLKIHRSGTENAWITWKAAPGAKPEVRPTGWNGLFVTASYNIIDGLHVIGINDSLVLRYALEDGVLKEKNGKPYSGDPKYNTNGIFVVGRRNAPDAKPHHNIIRNCVVQQCPGGGIVGIETDYLTIEDNLVYDNAWFMRYGGSGITTLNNWAYDDKPGYHFIIQRNQVWNNKTNVPWLTVGRLSDGNGILLDVTDQDEEGATNIDANAVATPKPVAAPEKSERPVWKGRSLVANNISAFNGGSGIHTFRHSGADIVNNTVYGNGYNMGYPSLSANRSTDIVFLNNVIVPMPGGKVTSNDKNKNVRWDYNLYSVKQTALVGEHDVVADPQFIKVVKELTEADFRLKPGSAALNSGTDELAQALDVLRKPRPAGSGRDRGAFEQ